MVAQAKQLYLGIPPPGTCRYILAELPEHCSQHTAGGSSKARYPANNCTERPQLPDLDYFPVSQPAARSIRPCSLTLTQR